MSQRFQFGNDGVYKTKFIKFSEIFSLGEMNYAVGQDMKTWKNILDFFSEFGNCYMEVDVFNSDENLICMIPESFKKYTLIYSLGKSLTLVEKNQPNKTLFLCDLEKHDTICLKSQCIFSIKKSFILELIKKAIKSFKNHQLKKKKKSFFFF